jgi:hypothetical protein
LGVQGCRASGLRVLTIRFYHVKAWGSHIQGVQNFWLGVFCCQGFGGEVLGSWVSKPMFGFEGCKALGPRVPAVRFYNVKARRLHIQC